MRLLAFAIAALGLAACSTDPADERPESVPTPPDIEEGLNEVVVEPETSGTWIRDESDAQKLLNNAGLTLQWISWERRGSVYARRGPDGTIRLTGSQSATDGPGKLELDGYVSEIGTGYFTFIGTIRIVGTPDTGRYCEADKDWHFAVTQGRPYWRLREFEWCDRLTDYVDIYMPGTAP